MGEARRRFHEQLRGLEDDVQRIGAQAQQLLATALQGLSGGDIGICEEVVKGDDAVDELYLEVEQRILQLFALQTPVASDLRLLTGCCTSTCIWSESPTRRSTWPRSPAWPMACPGTSRSCVASRRWAPAWLGWSTSQCRPSPAGTWSWP